MVSGRICLQTASLEQNQLNQWLAEGGDGWMKAGVTEDSWLSGHGSATIGAGYRSVMVPASQAPHFPGSFLYKVKSRRDF
jgi:hypothetical protein